MTTDGFRSLVKTKQRHSFRLLLLTVHVRRTHLELILKNQADSIVQYWAAKADGVCPPFRQLSSTRCDQQVLFLTLLNPGSTPY